MNKQNKLILGRSIFLLFIIISFIGGWMRLYTHQIQIPFYQCKSSFDYSIQI